jgi:hypothetical protein
MKRYIRSAYDGLKMYADANVKKFAELGKKYGIDLYGDVKMKNGEAYLEGFERTKSDADAFCEAVNRIANKYGYDAYIYAPMLGKFAIVLNEQ